MMLIRERVRTWLAHPAERYARWLLTVYVCLFPGSLWAVGFDMVPPDARWFGGVLLALQGGAALLWLWGNLGSAALAPSLFILGAATAVEYVGATTDQPFGAYDYTPVLGGLIGGVVPVVIPFAWLMVIYGTWSAVNLAGLLPSRGLRAVATGAAVAIFDIQIEPTATHINGYWRWDVPGFFYGVPAQNFIAWCVVGIAFAYVTDSALIRARTLGASRLPVAALAGSCVMFLVMNSKGGYWWASAVSVVSLVAMGYAYLRVQRAGAAISDTVAA